MEPVRNPYKSLIFYNFNRQFITNIMKSFLLVLLILSALVFIKTINPENIFGKYEEKNIAEKIQTKEDFRITELLARINDANKTITVLKEMLILKNSENDQLKKQLNERFRRTKRDAAIQTKSNEDNLDIKINTGPGNADLDLTDQEIIFKVQVISSGARLTKNSLHFKGIENVWEYKERGLYKYTVGNHIDSKSASVLQAVLRKKGLSEAFVVAFKNGKRIPVREAKELLEQSEFQ